MALSTELQEQNMRAIPEDSLLHSESLNNTYDTVQSQQLKAPKSLGAMFGILALRR